MIPVYCFAGNYCGRNIEENPVLMGIPFYHPENENVLVSHRIDYSSVKMLISTTHRAWIWKRLGTTVNILKYRDVEDTSREFVVSCYNGAFNRKELSL